MKGIELPISTIIVIILVLAVLIVLLTVFLNVSNPASSNVNLDAATKATCQKIIFMKEATLQAKIRVDNFDADKDDTINDLDGTDNLESLCYYYYDCNWGIVDWNAWQDCCIKKVCGKM